MAEVLDLQCFTSIFWVGEVVLATLGKLAFRNTVASDSPHHLLKPLPDPLHHLPVFRRHRPHLAVSHLGTSGMPQPPLHGHDGALRS